MSPSSGLKSKSSKKSTMMQAAQSLILELNGRAESIQH
jgi:hypothetical protein